MKFIRFLTILSAFLFANTFLFAQLGKVKVYMHVSPYEIYDQDDPADVDPMDAIAFAMIHFVGEDMPQVQYIGHPYSVNETCIAELETGKVYWFTVSAGGLLGMTSSISTIIPTGYIVLINGQSGSSLHEIDGLNSICIVRDEPRGKTRAGVAGSFCHSEVKWTVSLGERETGDPVGSIGIYGGGKEDDWAKYFTPEGLALLDAAEAGVYLLRDYRGSEPRGKIRQVAAKEIIVDVVEESATKYRLKFYNRKQTKGAYYFINQNGISRMEPDSDHFIHYMRPTSMAYYSEVGFSEVTGYGLASNFDEKTGHPFVEYVMEGIQNTGTKQLAITQINRDVAGTVVRQRMTRLTRTGNAPDFTWKVEEWNDVENNSYSPIIVAETNWIVDENAQTRTESTEIRRLSDNNTWVTDGAFQLTYMSHSEIGEVLVRKIHGGNDCLHQLQTRWSYYSEPMRPSGILLARTHPRWGKVKTILYPDGRWEEFDYSDATGLLNTKITPFMGNTASALPDNFNFSGEFPRISESIARRSIPTLDRKLLGMITATETRFQSSSVNSLLMGKSENDLKDERELHFFNSRFWEQNYIYPSQGVRQYARGSESRFGDSGEYLFLKRNRLEMENFATGKKVVHRYLNSNELIDEMPVNFSQTHRFWSYDLYIISRHETITGQSGNSNDPILIAGRSMKETVDRDKYGRLVRTEQSVWTGGDWSLLAWTAWEYNHSNQITRIVNHKGQAQTYGYIGDMKVWEDNGMGRKTHFTYDGMNRVTREHVEGRGDIPDQITSYEYDAMGLILRKTISSSSSGSAETLVFEWTYNTASQITSYAEPGKGAITCAYNVPARIKTTTYPDGSTLVESQYQDGKKKSITGSSVVHQYFTYDIDPQSGFVAETCHFGQDNGGRWIKTTKNWKGDIVKVVKSGNPHMVETFHYNTTTGLLERKTLTGMADTLYEYDCFGEKTREGLDIDGNGSLVDNSADEITTYTRGYVQIDNQWVYEEKKSILPVANSSASTTIALTQDYVGGETQGGRIRIGKTYAKDGDLQEAQVETWYDPSNSSVTTTTSVRGLDLVQEVSYLGLVVKTIKMLQGIQLEYRISYDELWRPSITTDPRTGGTITTYHPGTGLIRTVTDPAQNRMLDNTYDTMGRLVQSKDVFNKITHTEYTLRGEVARVWGENTYSVSYKYDMYGMKIAMRTYRDESGVDWSGSVWPNNAPVGDLTEWLYDATSGLLASKRDAKGKEVHFTYNAREQVKTKTLARQVNGQPLTLTYNYYGEISGEPNTGRLKEIQSNHPGTMSISYTYNRLGNIATIADATGQRTYSYNPAYPWRRTGEQLSAYYGNRTLTYQYEEAGNNTVAGRVKGFSIKLSQAIEKEESYTYLASGQLHTITETTNNNPSRKFMYGYETHAPLLKSLVMSNSSLVTTRIFEDHRDLITDVKVQSGANMLVRHGYSYDSMGRREQIHQSGEAYTVYYAGLSILRVIAYTPRSEISQDQASFYENALPLPNRHYRYGYDAIGNRNTSSFDNNQGVSSYQTNEVNQYVQRANAGFPLSGITFPDNADVTVNQVEAQRQGPWWTSLHQNNDPQQRAVLYPVDVQVSHPVSAINLTTQEQGNLILPPASQSFQYDEDGNLTSDGVHDYSYDAFDRLIQVKTKVLAGGGYQASYQQLSFSYDHHGRRVQKQSTNSLGQTTTTRYLYNGWHMIAEYNVETNDSLTPLRTYTWGLDISSSLTGTGGIGALLQIHDHQQGQDYHPAYDAAGNIIALHNPGTDFLDAIYEYSPFGETIRTTGIYARQNPLRYSTKYADEETGLLYYGLRYYSPDLGRFLNRDPIEEKGGLNLYGFVGNNPVNKWDVLGLSVSRSANDIDWDALEFAAWSFDRATGGMYDQEAVFIALRESVTAASELAERVDGEVRIVFTSTGASLVVTGNYQRPSDTFTLGPRPEGRSADTGATSSTIISTSQGTTATQTGNERVSQNTTATEANRASSGVNGTNPTLQRLQDEARKYRMNAGDYKTSLGFTRITVLDNGMVVTRSWWGMGKEKIYWTSPKETYEYIRGLMGAENMVALGILVGSAILATDRIDQHTQRQVPPDNQPKPPDWNDQWEWKPNPDGNYRWHDPNGGEWRRHEQDKWHPTPHWDYNPWSHPYSPWENRDGQGNPM